MAVEQVLVDQLPDQQRGIDRRGFEWYYWRRRTSPEVTLRGHNVSIARLVFSADGKRLASSVDSPDGERLASAGRGNVFRLWDAATGREIQTLKGQIQATSGVAFSPDGKRLAGAGPDLSVKIWDTATSEAILVLKGHNAAVTRVAFSADGYRLVSCGGEEVKVWDARPLHAEHAKRAPTSR